jgi:DnaJ-class molecular chaperone
MKTSPRVIISNIIKLFRRFTDRQRCPKCGGMGEVQSLIIGIYDKCPKCKGRGTILSSKAKSKGVHNYED